MPKVTLLGRRKVLVALGAAAGASALAGCALRPRPATGLAAALPAGAPLGRWEVEQVLAPVAGAIPVRMRAPGGQRFHVDILRRDPQGPRGVAETRTLALYLANRGDGGTPSAELEAGGARILGMYLAGLEARGALPEVPGLLTLSQRHAAHPDGVFLPWS